ncbi:MAG: CapA family protein, partial [Solirubrobacterales bacterium]|nr:CapA family protein [Solirubrobacterales bacterium]
MAQILALAGDTMLGRGVAQKLLADPAAPLVAPEVTRHIADADAFVLNLECCISERGERFADPRKPFFFRAPPVAAERLAQLGVDAVTLANNHALDFGADALLDTLAHLEAAGIVAVGAGADESAARMPRVVHCGSLRLRLIGVSDH